MQFFNRFSYNLKLILIVVLFVTTNSCRKVRNGPIGPLTLVSTVPHQTQNLIIVTIDGLRWQEVFQGTDSILLFNRKYVSAGNKDEMIQKFWNRDSHERRKELAPFFWKVIAKNGRLYGNRTLGNKVNVTNPYWYSYPGYNEIFTGYGDPRINSNYYGENPNYNILEFFNEQAGFEGNQVAAFCQWPKFTDILAVPRNHLYVIAGGQSKGPLDAYLKDSTTSLLNEFAKNEPVFSVNRENGLFNIKDIRTYLAARQYLEKDKPKVLYISFSETDKNGHWGMYDGYLMDFYNINLMLSNLWDYLQSDLQYKNKTTLFITADHGRGREAKWTDHGHDTPYSDEIWFAVMGPDTKPEGEIQVEEQLYQKQFAKSLAAFLGFKVKGIKSMGKLISGLMDE